MAEDWTTQAADAIEHAVAAVRDRTVVPARNVTKAVVYGLLASFFVLTAVVLLIIGVFRGIVILTGEVWIAYFVVGGILVLGGAFAWSRRNKRPKRSDDKGD